MSSQSELLIEEKIKLEKELEAIDLIPPRTDAICGTGLFEAYEDIKKKRDRLQEINEQLGVPRKDAPNCQVVISVSADKEADLTIGIKKGGPININVLLTNISNRPSSIPKGMDWYRPQLFHTGKPIPYKERVAKKIEAEDKTDLIFATSELSFFDSDKPCQETIELSYWYGELNPGHYLLSVERIFCRQRIRSNVVEFDIRP